MKMSKDEIRLAKEIFSQFEELSVEEQKIFLAIQIVSYIEQIQKVEQAKKEHDERKERLCHRDSIMIQSIIDFFTSHEQVEKATGTRFRDFVLKSMSGEISFLFEEERVDIA